MHQSNFEKDILSHLKLIFTTLADNTAFFIGNTSYTYRHLAGRVSAIRHTIRNIENLDKIIALAINDDIDTYASILALWMEGHAYLPLHPLHPTSRNLEIIRLTGTRSMFYTTPGSSLAEEAVQTGVNILCTSTLPDGNETLDECIDTPDNELAYILFTSGSTGTPKGVCITRDNLAAFIDSFWKTGINICQKDRCLQAFDLTFDVSIQAFLSALLRGACVYTIPYGQVKYLYAASLIMDQHITFAAMAPSMLTYLRPYFDQLKADTLNTTILTAEACPVDLAEDWFHCAKNTDIYDFYGPTEGTIYCTCHKLERNGDNLSANGIVAIGKPLANVDAMIIDENGTPVSVGEKGELCIAGRQVTPGYWRNEQRNASSFFYSHNTDTPIRYYHTGDLCQQTVHGNILYYGRLDHQAKIQGFRVELGEIEYHARNFCHCRTVAMAYTNNRKLTEIVLFIETAQVDNASLEHHLAVHLPHYMIPSRIICLADFPLNKSEKIDRPALASLLEKE